MSERPILFSGPMVRAILEGRKTQTRRVLKGIEDLGDGRFHVFNRHGGCSGVSEADVPATALDYIAYEVGDRLWVREAHAIVGNVDPGWVLYRASGYEEECARHGFDQPYPAEATVRWRPSIHMPRWASRITLEVTGVKVERLQDITEEDALAEGMTQETADVVMGAEELAVYASTHIFCPGERGRILFHHIWDQINGDGSWDANPWAVAITFRNLTEAGDER